MPRTPQVRREPASAPSAAPVPAGARRRAATIAAVAALVAAIAVLGHIANRPVPVPADASVDPAATPSVAATPRPPDTAPGRPAPAADHVGSATCNSCHAEAYAAWRGSQHARAMLPADADSVRGDFGDARFTHRGVTSTFSRRDGRHLVRTDGPDGRPGEFEIAYTFGVEPLQQYLVPLPGGRLQALGIAWDTRPRAAGGQRWFHLYPDRSLAAGDPLHWTGLDQTWNYQCADCHSTNLRKRFDASTTTYRTDWSEISVGCEACHGPASNHVAWARGDRRDTPPRLGLTVALDERRGVGWSPDADTGRVARSRPRSSDREIEVCARCHARRGQFDDAHVAGDPLHDAFRPALLEPGLYHPDGQQRDEVFTYGSFLQSRMHAKGVTCADCHEPHGGRLHARGNAVCATCHAPAAYDAPTHHHHRAGSSGAQCTACHMPTTTYMVVDPRHDHSMRIPRPDRSVSMGVPNACNACHADRDARWAVDRLAAWFPAPNAGFQSFAEALHAGDRGAPGAQRALVGLVRDAAQPAIARASALDRLARYLSPSTLPAVVAALDDADANVRMAAVRTLGTADPATRARHLTRRLADPRRVVRMDAARALADLPLERLAPADRLAFEAALAEYVAAQRFNADRPEAHAALAALALARGAVDDARQALRTALHIDPTYAQAAVNLADVERARGDEAAAEQVLRDALVASPRSAALRHALGLALVRQRRLPPALVELGEAARLAPEEPRFAWVHAAALHDTGRRADAIASATAALRRHPYDRRLLVALAEWEDAAGRRDAARAHVRLLLALEPDDPGVRRFAAGFDASR